jgi:hypothetical protein
VLALADVLPSTPPAGAAACPIPARSTCDGEAG